MAAFEAVERLQKFDWLIQKLHSLRSTFNSEQGIQELQKLHALQLLHQNGIQFNGELGPSEDDRILDEKMNGDEEDPEDDDELDDIEEDTEVLDDEEEENEDSPRTPKSESSHTTNNTSNGSHRTNYGLQAKAGIAIQNLDYSSKSNHESDINNSSDNAQDSGRYGRFPTGLFPPLPFDNVLVNEDSSIKVGQVFIQLWTKLCWLLMPREIGEKLSKILTITGHVHLCPASK